MHAFVNYVHFVYSGLPVPIVAIAAGIANEHYGTERGLVLLMVIQCSISDNCIFLHIKYKFLLMNIFSCWLSETKGTIWAFVAPMLMIILVS